MVIYSKDIVINNKRKVINMAKYGVFISENCSYTTDASKIRSAVNPDTVTQNGTAVTLSALATGERELWVAAKATASTKAEDIWVVTTPELIYDESKRYTLADFYNGINDSATEKVPMRVVKLEKGNIFGVTAEVLSKIPTLGDGIKPAADGTWTVAAASTTDFARFIGTTTNNGLTYYSFEAL